MSHKDTVKIRTLKKGDRNSNGIQIKRYYEGVE
jgi:hypothetical protein